MYKIATLSSGGTPVSVAGEGLPRRRRCDPGARDAQDQASCSSPIPTIRPAPTFPTTRCAACTRACRAACCWCSTRPTAEYVRRNDYEAGIELVATTDNTVMTRTFSKIYGLAALRLGWAYCPAPVADVLNRMRGPFNVTAPAHGRRRGGAGGQRPRRARRRPQRQVAALGHGRDREAGAQGDAERRQLRARSISRRRRARTRPPPTTFLKSRGIILRRVAAYGLPDCLRMTIGTEDDNRKVVAALASFLGRS